MTKRGPHQRERPRLTSIGAWGFETRAGAPLSKYNGLLRGRNRHTRGCIEESANHVGSVLFNASRFFVTIASPFFVGDGDTLIGYLVGTRQNVRVSAATVPAHRRPLSR